MRRHPLVAATVSHFLLSLVLIICARVTALAQRVPLAQHVILIIDENTSFGSVYPSGMPWLASQGDRYGYANNYESDHSGSLLDYLYLASGSCESNYSCSGAPVCSLPPASHNFYCNGNDCFTQNSCEPTVTKAPITDENIFHLMNAQAISWKVYAQNYLNAGGHGGCPGLHIGKPTDIHPLLCAA